MNITKAKILKWTRDVIIAIAGMLAVVIVRDHFQAQKNKPPSDQEVFQALINTASEINKNTPIMVDQGTRFDNAIPLSGRRIRYNYTLVNYLCEEIDTLTVIEAQKPLLINLVRTDPNMEAYRKLNIIIIYSYKDRENNHAYSITIKPEDYK